MHSKQVFKNQEAHAFSKHAWFQRCLGSAERGERLGFQDRSVVNAFQMPQRGVSRHRKAPVYPDPKYCIYVWSHDTVSDTDQRHNPLSSIFADKHPAGRVPGDCLFVGTPHHNFKRHCNTKQAVGRVCVCVIKRSYNLSMHRHILSFCGRVHGRLLYTSAACTCIYS